MLWNVSNSHTGSQNILSWKGLKIRQITLETGIQNCGKGLDLQIQVFIFPCFSFSTGTQEVASTNVKTFISVHSPKQLCLFTVNVSETLSHLFSATSHHKVALQNAAIWISEGLHNCWVTNPLHFSAVQVKNLVLPPAMLVINGL